ncbi:uncharacterized protein LOC135389974 [Ornithodoros turicata]|uniref:uncharacterized protein LOC135389974 n=1 Tax=Ornithodoros turicata TaxID=34597 RepID=UPI00313A137D
MKDNNPQKCSTTKSHKHSKKRGKRGSTSSKVSAKDAVMEATKEGLPSRAPNVKHSTLKEAPKAIHNRTSKKHSTDAERNNIEVKENEPAKSSSKGATKVKATSFAALPVTSPPADPGDTPGSASPVGDAKMSPRSQYVAKQVKRMTSASMHVPAKLEEVIPGQVRREQPSQDIPEQHVPGEVEATKTALSAVAYKGKRKSTIDHTEFNSEGRKTSASITDKLIPKSRRNSWLSLLCTVVSFAVIGVGLFFAIRHYFDPVLVMECTSGKCKKIQSDIVRLLDTSINPCEDVYGYVCGKWTKANKGGYLVDV